MRSWIWIALVAGVLGADGAVFAQPSFSEKQKLLASDGAPGDEFGRGALSGDRAVIGAPGDGDNGSLSGSAYVFERQTNGAWVQVQKLLASDGAAGDRFGGPISLSGDQALIAASGDGGAAGSVYVFERQVNGTWVQVQKLLASDGAPGDRFGNSMSLSGGSVLIGAGLDGDNGSFSGSAYVFERQANGTWVQVQKLLASDGAAGDQFGATVSLFGDRALIGMVNFGAPERAYVFEREVNGNWHQKQKLYSSDAVQSLFGVDVTISNDLAVVGAIWDGDNGSIAGAAYVFERGANGTWAHVQKLLANDGTAGDHFGSPVLVSGDRIFVGSTAIGITPGSVYVFDRQPNGQWLQVQKLLASDGAVGDYFGSTSLSGDRVLIGARFDDDNGNDSGSAYVFDNDYQPFLPYGVGCHGTGGVVPELALSGFATPGGPIQMDVLNGVGSGTALILLGLQQSSTHIGSGCDLLVAPLLPAIIGPIPLFPFGAQGAGAGSVSIPATVPAAIMPPATITLQAFVNDPGGQGGYSNTNGVELNIK